jgi:hypothetical protein
MAEMYEVEHTVAQRDGAPLSLRGPGDLAEFLDGLDLGVGL